MIYDNNNVMATTRGKIGDIYIRQFKNGKMYGSAMPRKRGPLKPGGADQVSASEFARASAVVKEWLKEPAVKAKYLAFVKAGKFQNSHAAAMTDYRRKAQIMDISFRNFNGEWSWVKVKIDKKDFPVREVHVTLVDEEGTIIESGLADANYYYHPKTNIEHPEKCAAKVRVVDTDYAVLEAVLKFSASLS